MRTTSTVVICTIGAARIVICKVITPASPKYIKAAYFSLCLPKHKGFCAYLSVGVAEFGSKLVVQRAFVKVRFKSVVGEARYARPLIVLKDGKNAQDHASTSHLDRGWKTTQCAYLMDEKI